MVLQNHYHQWVQVGSPANIDACQRCYLYRATTPKLTKRGIAMKGDVIEFSTREGKVIAVNPPRLPSCRPGLYNDRS